jgi:[ribosomal protein S5]-alanine N-acetyltransferase
MSAIVAVPVIETPSLLMREMRSRDAAQLAAFLTQPRYQRHIAHRLRDDTAVTEFVRRQVAAQGDRHRQIFHLAAEEKLSGDVVGEGFIISHGAGEYEVGWGVHPAMWSMGLGTEIGRALLAISFEHLKGSCAWCKIMAPNGASLTVARRIGMSEQGTQADYPVGQGRFERVSVYRIIAANYFDLPY